MLTFKEFLEAQEQMDEGITDYIPSADSVYAFGRNAADTATFGGYKYARAGADYAIKNTLKAVGLRKKGTTYKHELDQEKEKLASDDKNYPRAAAAGDVAGIVGGVLGPEIPAIGAAIGGAYKAHDATQKGSRVWSLARKALGY
jgi:hypothetical protein